MLYMFLICYNPTIPPAPGEPASRQAEHARLERELRAEGVYVSGAAMMPPAAKPIVRLRGGKVETLDGPFAESKELIGGYFIIDVKDPADIPAYAARIPVDSHRSWIDVQQIVLFHPNVEKIRTFEEKDASQVLENDG